MNHKARRFVFIVSGAAILVVAASFYAPVMKNKKGKVIIQFENYVGDKALELDSVVYENGYGQTYTISKVKYYISNIHLVSKDGKNGFVSNEYYLINQDEPASMNILLNDDIHLDYSSISFIIGVDSIHNCSGVQTGALDPVNGMFWAWNTGYVFFKLDGQSSSSKSSGNMLEFHVGGYKYPNNCIRTINLLLGNDGIKKLSDDNSEITIKADISKVFNSSNKIDFSLLSTVTDFHNATTIADNYANMFSILQQ